MTYTDPRSYLYQPGLLDPDGAQRITREALSACDDGELYLQYSATESFGFDDGRLKMADYSTGSGFGLRGVSGEMTGFSHANDLSESAIRRAGETLKLLDPAKEQPAPPPAQKQPAFVHRWQPARARAFCGKGRIMPADRRRGARA